MTNWTQVLITAPIGGVIGYLIKQFEIRGKVVLDNYGFDIHFQNPNFYVVYHTFDLHLQFSNTSGRTYRITDLSAFLFDGENTHKLQFEGYKLPPSFVLEPRQAKTISYRLISPGIDLIRPNIAYQGDQFVLIGYKENGKSRQLKIASEGINMMIIQLRNII